jgi:hypothetical protein
MMEMVGLIERILDIVVPVLVPSWPMLCWRPIGAVHITPQGGGSFGFDPTEPATEEAPGIASGAPAFVLTARERKAKGEAATEAEAAAKALAKAEPPVLGAAKAATEAVAHDVAASGSLTLLQVFSLPFTCFFPNQDLLRFSSTNSSLFSFYL